MYNAGKLTRFTRRRTPTHNHTGKQHFLFLELGEQTDKNHLGYKRLEEQN